MAAVVFAAAALLAFNSTYVPAGDVYGPSIGGLAAGDIDGDGDVDLAYTNQWYAYHSLDIQHNTFAQTGVVSFVKQDVDITVNPLWIGAVVDVNQDGYLDVTLDGFYGQTVLTGSDPSNTQLLYMPSNAGSSVLAVGDLNNDTLPDVVFINFKANYFWWQLNSKVVGPSFRWDTPQYRTPSFELASGAATSVTAVKTADVDGDGITDVIMSFDNDIGWFRNALVLPAMTPSFDVYTSIYADVQTIVSSVAPADLDSDGDVDICFTASTPGHVVVLVNLRNQLASNLTTFSKPVIVFDACPGASSVTAADIDSDGDLDLLVTCMYSASVSWIENMLLPVSQGNPVGVVFAAPKPVTATSTAPVSVIAFDANNDRQLDVAVSSVDNKVRVYLNAIDASYQAAIVQRNSRRSAEAAFLVQLQISLGLPSASIYHFHPCSVPAPKWPAGNIQCTSDGYYVQGIVVSPLLLGANAVLPAQGWDALSSLSFFNVSSTNLHGSVPAQLATLGTLKVLDLSDNAFSSLPSTLCEQPLVSCNALGGAQQYCYSGQSTCAHCSIETNICQQAEIATELHALQTFWNGAKPGGADASVFGGVHPCSALNDVSSVRELTCTGLFVSGISIQGEQLGGPCASADTQAAWQALATLARLTSVDLSGNQLGCDVDVVLQPFAQGNSSDLLQAVVLRNNGLTGTLSADMVRSLPMLRKLDLHNNSITGAVPTTFASLAALSTLDLSGNQLSGVFPDQLCSIDFTTCSFFGSQQQYCTSAKVTSCDSCAVFISPCPSPPPDFLALFLTVALPLAAALVISLLLFFVARLYNRAARNTIVFRTVLGVFDMGTDIAFVVELGTASLTNSSLAAAYIVGITFVAVPAAVNLLTSIMFLRAVRAAAPSANAMQLRWSQAVVDAIVLLLSMTKLELIQLLNSQLFKFTTLSADWSPGSIRQLRLLGWLDVLFQSVPHLGIQVYVLTTTKSVPVAVYLTLVTSIINLLYQFFERTLLTMLSPKSGRSAAASASGAGPNRLSIFTADVSEPTTELSPRPSEQSTTHMY